MAEAKATTYADIEVAKLACDNENKACKEKGEGKERFVFEITAQGEHKFYVVATLSSKARAIAALALDIKANVAEKKQGGKKSVVEQLKSGVSAADLDEIRKLLAEMDAKSAETPKVECVPEVQPETQALSIPEITDEAPKTKKGKKNQS